MVPRIPKAWIPAWIALLPVAVGADWPQFRGPDGRGVSDLAPPPARFGPGENRAWAVPVPPGHSSPVLVGGRLFLTAFEGGRLHTLAFDAASGRKLWQRTAPATAVEKVHEFASPASPTPMADARRVVVHFGSFGLLCYGHDGTELWSRPLPTPRSLYGTASSPVRVGDTAVVVLDSDDKASSRLLAVGLADGGTVWETPRPLSGSGWSTPALWEHDGRRELAVLGARRLAGYDAATGKDLWWVDGYSAETIGMPVAGDGMLFVSSAGLGGPPAEGFESMSWPDLAVLDRDGDGRVQKSEVPDGFRFVLRPELPPEHPGRFMPTPFRNLFDGIDGNRDGAVTEAEFTAFVRQWGSRATPSLRAIRPGGAGDVTRTHVAWQLGRGIPEIPSPLLHRGRLYLVRDGGFVTCVKASAGTVLYQERVGAPGSYCASPVAAGDRVFVVSHPGVVTCLDGAGDGFRVIANNVLGEKCWATPALGAGTIYIRTEKHLLAFSEAR